MDEYLTHACKVFKLPYDKDEFHRLMGWYYGKLDKELSKMDKAIDRERFFSILLDVYMSQDPEILNFMLGSIQQDVYFLLRLFMVFDEGKMERGPPGCQNSKYTPNNTIRANISFYTHRYSKEMLTPATITNHCPKKSNGSSNIKHLSFCGFLIDMLGDVPKKRSKNSS